jgi:hypothetical protein
MLLVVVRRSGPDWDPSRWTRLVQDSSAQVL